MLIKFHFLSLVAITSPGTDYRVGSYQGELPFGDHLVFEFQNSIA